MLCGSGEEVEGVAVQAISVFGHCITDKLQQSTSFLQQLVTSVFLQYGCLVHTTTQDTMAPLPPEGGVIGGVVLCRVLVFLSSLLQDLSKLMEYRRMSSMDPTLIPVGTRCVGHVTYVSGVVMCRNLIWQWKDSL